MNISELTDNIQTYVAVAAVIAVLIVAAVEAIRKRVAGLDGWKVLIVAGGVSVLVTGLLLRPADVSGVVDAVNVALLAWLIAVGGDAWIAKIATRSKQVTVLSGSGFDPHEAPTRPDSETLPPREP